MNKLTEEDILKACDALESAETPMDNRVMYYHKISWWRHPIKRWRQRRFYKVMLNSNKVRIKDETSDRGYHAKSEES